MNSVPEAMAAHLFQLKSGEADTAHWILLIFLSDGAKSMGATFSIADCGLSNCGMRNAECGLKVVRRGIQPNRDGEPGPAGKKLTADGEWLWC